MEEQALNNVLRNLTQLAHDSSGNSCFLAKKCLEEINLIIRKSPFLIDIKKFDLIVNSFCEIISLDEKQLVKEFCKIIKNFLKPQSALPEINIETCCFLIEWCLEVSNLNICLLDALQIINFIIRRCPIPQDLSLKIISVMKMAIKNKNEGSLYGLQCLEALTLLPLKNKDQEFPVELLLISNLFFDVLKNHKVTENPMELKAVIVCLKGIKNLTVQNPRYVEKNIGLLLGIIKSYMLYSIIDFMEPKSLKPTILSIPEEANIEQKSCGKSLKQKKRKTFVNDRKDGDKVNYVNDLIKNPQTSDSDLSDMENELDVYKLAATIRRNSLELFSEVLTQTRKNLMFSFWTSFIPEKLQTSEHYLTTCILKDNTKKCKLLALNILYSLLTSSKFFLLQAERGPENMSFTSFSVVLGFTIIELYKCLSLALNEKSIPVLTQVLKCIAALVQATKFNKLGLGLMAKVIRNVKLHVNHRDSTVQVAALGVLECILLSEPMLSETIKSLKSHEGDTIPFPLLVCLKNLNVEGDIPMAVKLESFKVLCAMTNNYFFHLMIAHLKALAVALDRCFKDRSQDVRFHSCKTMGSVGQSIDRYLSQEDNVEINYIDDCVQFWRSLHGGLVSMLHCDNPLLKSVACEALGSIGNRVFENLNKEEQTQYISLLFSSAKDKDFCVKTSAIGTLSIFVLYSSIGEDVVFIKNLLDVINYSIDSSNANIKIKCSWSLANLCEALQRFKHNLEKQFSKEFLCSLLKTTLKVSNENDKIKMNIVRALGHLIQLIDANQFESSFQSDLNNAIEFVVIQATNNSNMKVRWNACNAIGNILKNPTIYKFIDEKSTYEALMDLINNYENLKVRINAVYALSCPSSRILYGEFYIPIWASIIKALEKSQNINDLREYQHRDQLIESICLTLAHLTSVVTEMDLVKLKDVVPVQFELLKQNIDRIFGKILPQKSAIIFKAKDHLENLREQLKGSESAQIVLQLLFDLFSKDSFD